MIMMHFIADSDMMHFIADSVALSTLAKAALNRF